MTTTLLIINIILTITVYLKIISKNKTLIKESKGESKNDIPNESFSGELKLEDISAFKGFLKSNGCIILKTTRKEELVRFNGYELASINTNRRLSKYAKSALLAFYSNSEWDQSSHIRIGKIPKMSSSRKKNVRKELLERDGCNCFYCGKELKEDITIEHLISRVNGGKNKTGNLVLSHKKCNQFAGNKSVASKVKVAFKYRLRQTQKQL